MLLNLNRALDYMRRCQLDVLIATSPVNITYFSGFYCWLDPLFKEYMTRPGGSAELDQRYAVQPLEGEPALVVSPLLTINAADLWVKDLHVFGGAGLDYSLQPASVPEAVRHLYEHLRAPIPNKTPTDALISIFKARGLTGSRIGIEMDGLTAKARAELSQKLPNARLKDCSNLIRLVRMVKSEEEIRRLSRAAEITEIAAMEALGMARPGMSSAEIVGRYRARIGELGADLDHFAYGMYGMGIATEPEHRLPDNFVEYMDFGCRYQYYLSDSGTTLALHPLSEALEKRYAALQASMGAGRQQIRPGVKASAVQAAMQQALTERGITESYPHGHGVGLEVRDYPILAPDTGLRVRDDVVDEPADLPLEENMVINLEAPLFMPGVGSLHIEESYLVTAVGFRPLVAQERSKVFVPITHP